MGAADFEVIAMGKDLKQAFNAAVEQAQWEYGHGGYTGTIAEKGSVKYFGEVKGVSPASFRKHFWKIASVRWDFHFDYEKFRRADGTLNYDLAEREEERAMRAQVRKRLGSLPKSLQGIITDDMVATYSDKWGPACAVQIGGKAAAEIKARNGRKGTHDKVYMFFGLASS